MLHSSLPRAFLPPEFNYLGYYSDEVHQHPCAPPTTWHIPMHSPPPAYARIPEHHALQSWDSSRSSTPCPLDLSLKPPPTPTTPSVKGVAETEDENYRRAREEIRGQSEHGRYRKDSEDDPLVVDDLEALPGHDQLLSKKEPIQIQETPEKTHVPEEVTRLASFASTEDIGTKYYPHDQKVLLGSPSHHLQSVQSYHQQLLLTPQYHLQGMQHAPMTPPSTPSPPQCPRRRVREEEGSPLTSLSAGGASATSPRQSNAADKSLQRPKKKHARRLKFDEDTSSPVSGTVILGPDEAVVTGDIDPAFNIVEVTEEARAELAKIENRLGPYQCKLCRQLHEDAFQLAQHRCSRIAHVEYRCPECDKRFSCPANLASHRRWHKPRLPNGETGSTGSSIEIPCGKCEAKFTRQAAYRKHLATQHPENENNNVPMETPGAIGKPDAVHLVADGPSNTEMP